MNQDQIEATIAFHEHECGTDPEDLRWLRYVKDVEQLLNVADLDGDSNVDGYSIDDCHDFFVDGLTAGEAADEFRARIFEAEERAQLRALMEQAEAAVMRSHEQAPTANWRPIYSTVKVDGQAIGHVVSNGYTLKTWNFHPYEARRRMRSHLPLEAVLPAWATKAGAEFGPFETIHEKAGEV